VAPLTYVFRNVKKTKDHYSITVIEKMPVVQVSVWAGISPENKKKIVEGITQVIQEVGVPREAITIILYEVPKTDWASGGQLHSERFADR
jgi:4-oxalocrotonate tautomerase